MVDVALGKFIDPFSVDNLRYFSPILISVFDSRLLFFTGSGSKNHNKAKSDITGIRMMVRGTQPGVQFYTSQFLNGTNGKARVSIPSGPSGQPWSLGISGHPIKRRSFLSSPICFLSRNSTFSRFTKSQKFSIS